MTKQAAEIHDSSPKAQSSQRKTKQVIGGRIFDEKSLLCERAQGRILGVCNRRARDAIKDLSQKANAQTPKSGF